MSEFSRFAFDVMTQKFQRGEFGGIWVTADKPVFHVEFPLIVLSFYCYRKQTPLTSIFHTGNVWKINIQEKT